MCGIGGMVDLAGGGRATLARVQGITARITHRGPDGDGFYTAPGVALGMRRLSIIDVAGSDQPLFNEDETLALVFNGEIYNYRELRAGLIARGHVFRTEGDGETILHLYEEYGLDFPRHLRGMFAFALWDSRRARLVLAVDHIGMKPLYLHEQDGLLSFASEVKALMVAGGSARLDLGALDTFFAFGYPIGAETLFAGVRRLMPGCMAVIEHSGVTERRWAELGDAPAGFSVPEPVGDTAVIEAVRAQMAESVRLHLRADVPLGLFLSGGVDSAAMLALMTREIGPVETYTVGYAGRTPDDELAAARRIAAHFGAHHHERVITADDWWSAFDGYVYHHDEPNANPSAVSLMLLAEHTARDVRVVLTGLGGDELFGGYANHRIIAALLRARARYGAALTLAQPLGALLGLTEAAYPMLRRARVIGALPHYLPRVRHALLAPEEGLRRSQSFDGTVFSDGLRARLYSPALTAAWRRSQHKERTFAALLARSQRNDAENQSPADTALALVMNTWLAGNALLNCDKVTMAHSLESRVPFFDPALIAQAMHTPPELRMRANKHILREAMRPLLPAFALERPKQPFGTPIASWFAHELRDRIAERLLDPGARIRPLLNAAALEALVRAHVGGRAVQTEVVFRLLTLETWMRVFNVQVA